MATALGFYMSKLKWINSRGGPLVLMDSMLVGQWRGTAGYSGLDPLTSDYQRACAIKGFIGKVDVGSGEAAIMGDEPAQSALVSLSDGDFVVVRWICANGENEILLSLESALRSTDWEDSGLTVTFTTGNPTLFDSALSNGKLENCAVLKILPGIFGISTLWYRPNELLSIVLHRFLHRRIA